MVSLNIPLPQIQTFFLIFLRVGAILFTLPLFDNKTIPVLFKAGLAFTIALVLYPVLDIRSSPCLDQLLPFVTTVCSEVVIGMAIGLSVKLVFSGIQLAGQLAGYQMGFAIVNVMDPMTAAQVSVIAHLKYLMALLIFLTLNAHHWMLRAMAESFHRVPPFGAGISRSLSMEIVGMASAMFVISIKIAAPVMVALLLTTAALGLVARTVPQMNIFIVGFPLKIVVGLLFLAFTAPYFAAFLENLYSGLGTQILNLMTMAGVQ